MADLALLIATIKRELKRQGLTYRDVAKSLHLSEASVKRLFSSRRLTVARLLEVSTLLGYTLADLAQLAQASAPQLRLLSLEHEARLVAEPKLLLVAVCLLNHWTLGEVVASYRLTEAEAVKRALQLDRMGLLALLPGNRVRLKVSREFDWNPDGAIRAYFRSQGQNEFLADDFAGDLQTHAFVQGMLSGPAQAQLMGELRRLRARFGALHDEGVAVPLAQKQGVGLLLALREWEPAAFAALRRSPAVPGPARLAQLTPPTVNKC